LIAVLLLVDFGWIFSDGNDALASLKEEKFSPESIETDWCRRGVGEVVVYTQNYPPGIIQ